MIFIHLLIGIILGKIFGNYLFFILGSVIVDLDHIFIIIKNRFYSINKIKESLKHEKKFNVKYKTPLFHSVLGLILFSFIVYLFYYFKAIYFAIAYLLHLLIDWLDIDEKYYLYPLRIKFNGFLPIWSKTEKIATLILILIIAVLYFYKYLAVL